MKILDLINKKCTIYKKDYQKDKLKSIFCCENSSSDNYHKIYYINHYMCFIFYIELIYNK